MTTLPISDSTFTKEKHQFLRQDGAGEIVEEGSLLGATRGLAAMGLGATAKLAGSAGATLFQRWIYAR